MKKSIVLLLTFCSLNIINIYGQANWKNYMYKAHNFEIEFMQEPEFSVDSSEFEGATLVSYEWVVHVEDTLHQNTFYSISVIEYPSDYIHSDSLYNLVEGFINSSQSSLEEDPSFTLLTSSLTEKNGYPGKIYKWKSTTSNMFLTYQVYMVGSKLITLSAVTKAGESHNTSLNKFFNSFALVDVPQGSYSIATQQTEASYEIDFPEKANTQTRVVDSEAGKLNIHIQLLEPTKNDENIAYMSVETKYPNMTTKELNTYALNQLYMRSINGALNSSDGELISLTDIDIDTDKGKEFRFYVQKGVAISVYRVLYSKDTMYMYGVITSPDRLNNKAMKKFLESFKINK